MNPPYSLRQIKTDGVITAPRWMHHIIKVITSLAAFVGLLVLGVPILRAGVLASVVLFACVWIKERVDPTDVEPHTLWEHVADALTDCADACVTLAAAVKLVYGWRAGLVVLAACVVAWIIGHKDARP